MKRIFLLYLALLLTCAIGAKPVKTRLKISNASSKSKIEHVVKQIHGVTHVTFNTSNNVLEVTYDNKKTNTSKIRAGVKKAGYVIGSFSSSKTKSIPSRQDQKARGASSSAPPTTRVPTTN